MFEGWTEREIAEYRRNIEMTDRFLAGDCQGYSRASIKRWLLRRRIADEGNPRFLLRGKSTGRGTIEILENEANALRAAYVTSNRARGKGSMTYSARSLARDPDSPLRQEVRDAILKPRASKHILPVNVRRAMRGADAVVADYRDPRSLSMGTFFAPGTLRMTMDPDGTRRRLHGGERWCVDDASVNFGVCIPWTHGGDPCSERYGVRLGRYQLLAAIDCASDFCVGFTYTMREKDAYRGDDVVAMLNNVMSQQGYSPKELVVEGGAWQSRRVMEFLRLVGIEPIDAKGRPHQKLIEGWLNRLWVPLSTKTGGQIGRFRGEMRRENILWQACREGREDPRKHFPDLQKALNAIADSVAYLNADVTHGEKSGYGSWIPVEMHKAGIVEHARPDYANSVGYLAARVRVERKVSGGRVKCTAESPLGFPEVYHFESPDLMEVNGASVWLHFDPFANPVLATITLAQPFADRREGEVVVNGLEPVNSAPELIVSREGTFRIGWHDGVAASRRAKSALSSRVRRETVAMDLNNRRTLGISETSGPAMPEPGIEEIDTPADHWTPGDAIKTGIQRTIKTRDQLLEASAS